MLAGLGEPRLFTRQSEARCARFAAAELDERNELEDSSGDLATIARGRILVTPFYETVKQILLREEIISVRICKLPKMYRNNGNAIPHREVAMVTQPGAVPASGDRKKGKPDLVRTPL